MAAGKFIGLASADRKLLFDYLAEHRLNHVSFLIDKMQELNRKPGSIFYGVINEEAGGICGHSLGGVTALGKIGAHPDSCFEDSRIKVGDNILGAGLSL